MIEGWFVSPFCRLNDEQMNRKTLALLLFLLSVNAASAQLNPLIDVLHYEYDIRLGDSDNVIRATAIITTKCLKDVREVTLDLMKRRDDGKGMVVTMVSRDGKNISFEQDAQSLIIFDTVPAQTEITYTIRYEGIPANGLIISKSKFGNRTFFADNWPNRAHDWLPCNDHVADKASVAFAITAPDHYQVVANGIRVEETNLPGQLKLTRWREDVPLPPDIFAIGVAAFAVNLAGYIGCVPVYSWVYPENRDSGFARYAVAKDILAWYISHIGPYPYRKLANVQSKTIFGGMENANTIFYFEGSVDSAGLESLMAHEIAHQWFGNSASEKDWPHLWLSEGFATYMADLYHESKYGLDSFRKRLVTERETVIRFSKKRYTPVVDTTAAAYPMQLLNPNSYQKGAWILHMLRRKLGDSIFWSGIRNYYATYAGSNAGTRDLQRVFEATGHQTLDRFFTQWLYSPGQPRLDVSWAYKKRNKTMTITVSQLQEQLFAFPLQVEINDGSNRQTTIIDIRNRLTVTTIPLPSKPVSVILDPDTDLLFEGTVKERK